MDQLLDNLRVSIKNEDIVKIVENLNSILQNSDKVLLKEINLLEILLKYTNNDILILTTQAIAELAKNEKNRACLTNEKLVEQLLPFLDNADYNLKLQCCRALGNICFENENARKIINKDGLQKLMNLITNTLNVKSFDSKLISTSCGCLMNLIMNNDELQKSALDFHLLEIIETVLKHNLIDFESNEDCTTHCLVIMTMVVEHMIDEWVPQSLCSAIVDILRASMNPEISALCLEILRMQCENDDIKLCLAQKGTCELVYDLVEKHGRHVDDEESRSVLKLACDLIVLILTGDDSMELLYDKGNGKVYDQMVYWLNSEDTDLLSTGVLAIGNFARNDSHCIQMVENGLAKKLLGILKYYSSDGDTKVQHALLSTLRNLSIPYENKSKLLDENLVDTLLSMLNIDHSPVEFKLLGTLRMVVDGQEKTATDLISRKEFIEKLVHWCYNSDHLGVRGEAPRLLAWLIKNCRSTNSYAIVLSIPNAVKCLVEMMSSMHAVMQNEAIHALVVLCATCLQSNNIAKENELNSTLPTLLIEAEIGKNIYFVIEKYNEKMENQTVENLVCFVSKLVTDKSILNDLKSAKVADQLAKLLKSYNIPELSEKIKNLISVILV